MIAAQQQVTGMVQARVECVLYEPNLQCQFLESAQRALGFVQVVNLLLQFRLQRAINRLYVKRFHRFRVSIIRAFEYSINHQCLNKV